MARAWRRSCAVNRTARDRRVLEPRGRADEASDAARARRVDPTRRGARHGVGAPRDGAALVGHVYSRRSSPGVELAGLLGLLQDLRALVEGSKEQCLSDKMKARKLPPLLAELWDVST